MGSRRTRREAQLGGKGSSPLAKLPRVERKARILVGFPTLRWQSTCEIASLMLKLGVISEMPQSPWEFSTYTSSGQSGLSYPVDYQRNLIMAKAIEGNYDWLWFIDSDVLPDSDSYIRLLMNLDKADVVAGIYPMFGKHPDPHVAWAVYENKTGLDPRTNVEGEGFVLTNPYERTDPLIWGGAAGTGNMLISAKIMRDDKMYLDATTTPKTMFKLQYETTGKLIATEDMDFCRRVRNHGYTFLTDTYVRWGHVKTSDVRFTEDAMKWAYDLGFKTANDAAVAKAKDVLDVNAIHADLMRALGRDEPVRSGDALVGVGEGLADGELVASGAQG